MPRFTIADSVSFPLPIPSLFSLLFFRVSHSFFFCISLHLCPFKCISIQFNLSAFMCVRRANALFPVMRVCVCAIINEKNAPIVLDVQSCIQPDDFDRLARIDETKKMLSIKLTPSCGICCRIFRAISNEKLCCRNLTISPIPWSILSMLIVVISLTCTT